MCEIDDVSAVGRGIGRAVTDGGKKAREVCLERFAPGPCATGAFRSHAVVRDELGCA